MVNRPPSSRPMLPIRHSRSETCYSVSTVDSSNPLLPSETNRKSDPPRPAAPRIRPESQHRIHYSPKSWSGSNRRPNVWRNATVLASTTILIWTAYSTVRYFAAVSIYSSDTLRSRIDLILGAIHAFSLLALLLYLFLCVWMRRSSATLHLTSLITSLALLLSSVTNLVFIILWHRPTGPASSVRRATKGRCDFAFDIFWTGTGGSCYPGISWGYLFAGAVVRVVLTGTVLIIMHLALWKWTVTQRAPPSRGAYTNVVTDIAPTGLSMTETRWESRKKNRPPPALNLAAPVESHRRTKSGDSAISADSTVSSEPSPTPTAEQLQAWAAQFRTRSQQQHEDDGEEEITLQFAACDSPSPQASEFTSSATQPEIPSVRLGRIPGIVHRLSTIESASEGGVSRTSTLGRATPSASIHLSINGWTSEFGVTREGSHGTNASGSSTGVRRMDSFVSAFSTLPQSGSPCPSPSPITPSHPRFPDRVATSDSFGSSSIRTEYFNAIDDDTDL